MTLTTIQPGPIRSAVHQRRMPRAEVSSNAARSTTGLPELREYIARNQAIMIAVARRFFRCEADCEDAVQDACLCAVRFLPQFRRECSLDTWIGRILMNSCRMKRRSRSRKPTLALDEATEHSVTCPESTPVWSDELRAAVRDALRTLTEPHRTVIQLRYFEGFTTAETAELLGLGSAAVKTRLHRGCRALRTALEQTRAADFL